MRSIPRKQTPIEPVSPLAEIAFSILEMLEHPLDTWNSSSYFSTVSCLAVITGLPPLIFPTYTWATLLIVVSACVSAFRISHKNSFSNKISTIFIAMVGCNSRYAKESIVFLNLTSSPIISSPSNIMLPAKINISPRLAYGATNGTPSLYVSS